MPTLAEYVDHFGIADVLLTILIIAIVLMSREGWRIKNLFRRKS